MSELREKTQADFDLEKLFELMDEALTSKDTRVQNALRGLLTIIELTRTQDDGRNAIETSHGPLRQMQEDLNNMNRRLWTLQEDIRKLQQPIYPNDPPRPYTPGPYNPGYPHTGTMPINPPGTGVWWGIDPNKPYTTSTSYTTDGDEIKS